VKRSTVRCVAKKSATSGELGRQSEPAILILTSLASGSKHGYSLAKDIESFAGVVLGPGTLYGAITRLEERGLVEALPTDDRRQPYRITVGGLTSLTTAIRDMRALADEGASRIGISSLAPRSQPRPLSPGLA
jgi:DNA-binding PadR family transcriptional regulator